MINTKKQDKNKKYVFKDIKIEWLNIGGIYTIGLYHYIKMNGKFDTNSIVMAKHGYKWENLYLMMINLI